MNKDELMAELMNVEIGKYTLESLTTGMYSEPKIVYREYIQNSVDSLEEAVAVGLIEEQGMRIDIIVDAENSKISIRDNGMGVEVKKAPATLLNIGNSNKRQSNNRGFRGIGRLGGMSYCNTLRFITSAAGENKKTVVQFNCKHLRELLVPGKYEQYNLKTVLEEITTIIVDGENESQHYFLVELEEVSDFSDLLDLEKVKEYICQVAPVTYSKKNFYYSSEVHRYMEERGYIIEEFPLFLGYDYESLEPINKPNRHRFHADRKKQKEDEIEKINYFEIFIDDECYALGWYAESGWLGTISESNISGIRVRKGNILIGDSRTLNTIYKESRFNGWVQGELFIVTDKLIPNARRDDFEQNVAYYKLITNLQNGVGAEISRLIREASGKRNDISAKVIKEVEKTISDAQHDLSEGFNSSVDKDRLVKQLLQSTQKLENTKIREDLQEKKDELIQAVADTAEQVTSSNNYKINKVNSGVDRKSKKILAIISDILSEKLSKFLVDEILEEIVEALNGK